MRDHNLTVSKMKSVEVTSKFAPEKPKKDVAVSCLLAEKSFKQSSEDSAGCCPFTVKGILSQCEVQSFPIPSISSLSLKLRILLSTLLVNSGDSENATSSRDQDASPKKNRHALILLDEKPQVVEGGSIHTTRKV